MRILQLQCREILLGKTLGDIQTSKKDAGKSRGKKFLKYFLQYSINNATKESFEEL
jgi:hypothetical protein